MVFLSFLETRLRASVMAGLVLLGALNPAVFAQSPYPSADGFAPNPNGIVTSMAVQADGKILMAGYFTQLRPFGAGTYGAGHIARVNHDGSVDTGFSPNVGDVVRTLVLEANGQILIGGQFTTVQPSGGGAKVTRNYAARLNADGSVDSAFNPNANGTVFTIAVQSDGKIIIGGSFTTVQPAGSSSPVTRNHIARLNVDGSLDAGFDPNANKPVLSLGIEPNGQIIVGGGFSTLQPNGAATATTRNCIARINSDGSLDTAFDPEANGSVMAIAVLPNGQIAIAGEFTQLQPNGASAASQCDFLGRLNNDGTLDTTFTVNPLAAVVALAVQADGKLLIGGSFTTLFPVNSSGEQSYAYLARINPDGSIDANYSPTPNQEVDAIALQADGSAVIGGYFTAIQAVDKSAPVPAAFAGRILPSGAVDATLAPDTDGGIFATVQDSSSGKWYIGGTFTSIDGLSQAFLARLNSDGSLDRTYTPTLNGSVQALALQSDGKLLVGGNFTAADGVVRAFVMRLNTDGTVDGPFNPSANGKVNLIHPLANGQILITGLFTALYPNGFTTGVPSDGFARLNSDGSVDVSFNPNPLGGSVFAIAAQSDGNLIIAGEFTSVGGLGRSGIARISTSGVVDTGFNPSPNSAVYAVAIQSDGKIILGGSFTLIAPQTSVAGNTATNKTITTPVGTTITVPATGTSASVAIPVNHLARVNKDGTLDTTFFPDASDTVLSLALQSNGAMVVGGSFTSFDPYGGPSVTLRNYIGRLNSDGSIDAGFNPNANGQVSVVQLQSSGQLVVAGSFTTLQPNGSSTLVQANHIAVLNSDGSFNSTLTTESAPPATQEVTTLAIQPSGQFLVGGNFSPIDGAPGSNLIRINPDGAPDLSYNPVFDGPVNAIGVQPHGSAVSEGSSYALWLESTGGIRHAYSSSSNGYVSIVIQEPDGKILVGGQFSSFAGSSNSANLVRINSDGTLDTTFNPNPNGAVDAIAIQSNGQIVIGGGFTTVNGKSIAYLARLNLDGTVDTAFNPAPDLGVTCIAIQSDGMIIVGGYFSSVETSAATTLTVRGQLARFKQDGTLDTAYYPVLNGTPFVLALQPSDGKLLIGGSFTTILPNNTGTAINRSEIARLNTDGTVDANFDPSANGTVLDIQVASNGDIYAGGNFTQFQPNPTYTTTNGVTTPSGTTYPAYFIGRIHSDGTIDSTFVPYPNAGVDSIALMPNGQIVVGGSFTAFQFNGYIQTTRDFIARLNSDGTLDSTFDPGLNSGVASIALLNDGSLFLGGSFTAVETGGAIFVGGAFTHVGGITQKYLVELNADSTVNAKFTNNTDGPVNAIVPGPTGYTLVGGSFNTIGTNSFAKLARLQPDGSVDTTFNPNPNGTVDAIALMTNGNILVGGLFTNVGGRAVSNLALLAPSGAPVAGFAPSINGTVDVIVVQPNGQIVIGGSFTSVAGVAVGGVARLNANGTVDATFNPFANGTIYTISRQVDGTFMVGGSFTSIGGNAIPNLARLTSAGAVDTTFNPAPNGTVYAVTAQTDGKPIFGGAFTSVGGLPRFFLARLSTQTQPTESISSNANETTLTWTRTGSVPAFSSVIFEESTDDVDFTTVGEATTTDGMTWTLSNLTPSGATTFYVRATGVVPSSRYTSTGLAQTIALINILAQPTITSAPNSTGVAGTSFTFVVTASQSPRTFAATGLPPGLSINKATGLISGTPTSAGNYTATVTATGAGGTTSSSLNIQIAQNNGQNINASVGNRLLNLSSRDELSGKNILIAGFVIQGTGSKKVLLRAVGPGLAVFNVTGPMATPEIQLYSSAGTILDQNSGWGGSTALAGTFAQVGAFALQASSADAALVETLSPGAYTMQVFDPSGDGGVVLMEIYDASPSPLTAPQRLINISARGTVSPGAGALIGGFVIEGSANKTVLIRGIGPGLSAFGVANALADPVLRVFDSAGNVVAQNLVWSTQTSGGADQVAGADIATVDSSVGAFALTVGSADTALVASLPPGSYTFQVTSASNATGEALGEVYEVP
ncbi:MAG TPA: putative Ig domain-containing protein [Opitutaceae bacterium]|jgi:uncharacterized delta-60 repeat protein